MTAVQEKSKFPTVITPEVFSSLYETLEKDVLWFCGNKGIPADDRPDVFHDCMEKVWADRELFTRMGNGRSPATFMYLKLRTAVMEYFNWVNTGTKSGNIQSKVKINTYLNSYEEMFLGYTDSDQDTSSSLSLQYEQLEPLNVGYAEVFKILDKMPDLLREYVVCKAEVDTGGTNSSRKELTALMLERGLPVRMRNEVSKFPTVDAYESRLRTFLTSKEIRND